MDKKLKEYALEIIGKIHTDLSDDDYMEQSYKESHKYLKQGVSMLKIITNGEVPGALFEIGEFVHYRGNEVVEINYRAYTEDQGWVYGITYRKIDKVNQTVTGDGGSCYWEERLFRKIEDPLLILIIKKHELIDEKRNKEREIKVIDNQLNHLAYSLNLVRSNDRMLEMEQ